MSLALGGVFALASVLCAKPVRAQEVLDEPPAQTLANDKRKPSSKGDAKSPDSERDGRARHLFEAGRAAWDEGAFRQAWEDWRESYRLSKRPALLYNIGQAADRLRMDREALEAFRMYLEKNPDAPNRREVETRIRVLEREIERDALRAEQGMGPAGPETLPDDSDYEPPTEHSLRADDEDPGDDAELEPAQDAKAPGAQPEREEWYVRVGAGLGLFGGSFSDTAGNEATLQSLTFALDGSVGYGVRQGLVVGGRVLMDFGLNASVEPNGGASQELKSVRLLLISAFVDYYLSPRSNGFHMFGGLGFGSVAISDDSATLGQATAGGGAIYAGAGYEWPLGEDWAWGVEGRLLAGRFSQDLGDHMLLAPVVSASVVWY
jgi:hypothetical protein